MKVKNVNLEYWAFYIRNNEIVKVNVLEGIPEYIKKRTFSDRQGLKGILRREFMYHYWAKSEYEVAILDLFDAYKGNTENAQKKDVWFQIEPNLDMITDYVINKMDIKF